MVCKVTFTINDIFSTAIINKCDLFDDNFNHIRRSWRHLNKHIMRIWLDELMSYIMLQKYIVDRYYDLMNSLLAYINI